MPAYARAGEDLVPYQLIVHIHNEDPFVAEVDQLPAPADLFLKVRNPRKRDGKPLPMLAHGVTTVLYPWSRITFVEVVGGAEPPRATESVMSFFREDNGD